MPTPKPGLYQKAAIETKINERNVTGVQVAAHSHITWGSSTEPNTIPSEKSTGIINAASAQILDTAGDRVEFFSRVFCSPAASTLINAVKKKWISFPGITANILKRHIKRLRTHESAAGHLDQVHQNHKPQQSAPASTDTEGKKTPLNIVTYIHEEGNHMDATGRFTVAVSTEGHQYIWSCFRRVETISSSYP